MGTRFGQRIGTGKSNAACSTRDHRNPAVQLEFIEIHD
jgi:hypothetical protein